MNKPMNHEEYDEICSTLPDLARAIEAIVKLLPKTTAA